MSRRDDTTAPAARADAAAAEALSLDDVSRVCAVSVGWLRERVDAGLIDASVVAAVGADDRERWRFDAVTVHRVRRMARLERDFDAVPELAALVADLHDEIDALRRRLLRAGL